MTTGWLVAVVLFALNAASYALGYWTGRVSALRRTVRAQEEADAASRAFRDSLPLKRGEGYAAMDAARRELARDKRRS